MEPAAHLKEVFGYDCFLPNQEEIVGQILAGRDVFAVMPTGGGKSLCYQLPARILPGAAVVVSPLISLMKDQVDAARMNGLRAEYLNSSLGAGEKAAVLRALRAGKVELLYISPERFALEGFAETLGDVRLSLFAIDEAHCVSEWGHDFRPDYLALSAIPELFPHVPVAAFTATATQRVQDDIVAKLGLREPFILRASFDRPNLFYQVKRKEKVNEQLLEFLAGRRGESGIVYRTTRDSVMETAEFLTRRGVSALPYHAGLSKEERTANQDAFDRDEVSVVVATVAFGMGIDKSNVRFVVHGDLPKHVESYYQETGRAGRDGAPARCLLLFGRGDIPRIRHFIDPIEDEHERAIALEKLRQMISFASHRACRRKQLLAFFGERYPAESCGGCDVCAGEAEEVDITVDAQVVLSAIARTSQRFGAGHVIDVVMGADTERIRTLGHDSLKTYGAGKGKPRTHWRFLVDELIAQEAVLQEGGKYPILSITGRGRDILHGKERIAALLAPETKKSKSAGKPAAHDLSGELFARLRALRKSLADSQGVPPYMIFSDKTLIEMCRRRPATLGELRAVSGVGDVKLQRYGERFLEEIAGYRG